MKIDKTSRLHLKHAEVDDLKRYQMLFICSAVFSALFRSDFKIVQKLEKKLPS